ncbi:MAG: response regulator transcription factor [Bacteroidota bacterium]
MADLNILHASAQTLSRAGLKALLTRGGGVEKLDEAESLEDVVRSLNKELYDLLIIEFDRDSPFNKETIIQLQGRQPHPRCLIVASHGNEDEILDILESGINGCITRSCDEGEILNAIFAISKGEKFFCNKIIDIILQKHLYKKEEELDCEPTALSVRETEITALIASGLTNKEIAQQLFLSTHTVSTHRKNIMKKLQLRSVSELTIYAVKTGIFKA